MSMPPATLLVYGKAEGGTPIMIATPASALDLPLRVLVFGDGSGRTYIAFHPIAATLAATGVPSDLAAHLEPGQTLLLKTLENIGEAT